MKSEADTYLNIDFKVKHEGFKTVCRSPNSYYVGYPQFKYLFRKLIFCLYHTFFTPPLFTGQSQISDNVTV